MNFVPENSLALVAVGSELLIVAVNLESKL